MILPKKHIKLSESLFAMGAVILNELSEPKTIDEIWESINTNKIIDIRTFDNLVLTLDYLFCINVLEINDNGEVMKCI